MPSNQERFQRELDRLIERSLTIDDKSARKIIGILRGVRSRVAAAILDAEGFDLFQLQNLQSAVDLEFQRFITESRELFDEDLTDAFEFGAKIIDEPLSTAGLAIQVSALPQVSVEAINAQIQRGTQFITNLSVEAANKINGQLLLSISGEQTPFQAMKAIGNINRDGTLFNTIGNGAERIVRTEVNAALNTGTVARLEQAQRQIGGMKKFWIHTRDKRTREEHIRIGTKTNPEIGGKPIPVNRDFVLLGARGTEKAKGPLDPRLSAANSIQCRCRLGFTSETVKEEEPDVVEQAAQVVRKAKPKKLKTLSDVKRWAKQNKIEIDFDKSFGESEIVKYVNNHIQALNKIESAGINISKIGRYVNITENIPIGAYASAGKRFGRPGYAINPKLENQAKSLWKENIEDINKNLKPIMLSTNSVDVAIHEIGHNLDKIWSKKSWDNWFIKKGDSYFAEFNRVPSLYAQENSSEALAESFLALINGDKSTQSVINLIEILKNEKML